MFVLNCSRDQTKELLSNLLVNISLVAGDLDCSAVAASHRYVTLLSALMVCALSDPGQNVAGGVVGWKLARYNSFLSTVLTERTVGDVKE
ncbi:MAG: hypothetical protein OEM42_02315 [Deltaproteobacteria bacterium]|nr:hypothetical protein [Deltaproteobacteria bacterium]